MAVEFGETPGEFTTLPAVPLRPRDGPEELLFPQFASGSDISSSLFLVGVSEATTRGTVHFIGDDGSPIRVGVDGEAVSEIPFSLAAHAGSVFTSNDNGDLFSGWAKVVSDGPVGGMLRFRIPGLGFASVGATKAATSFITPVRRSVESGLNTGVAIVSTETTLELTLTLRDPGGAVLPNGNVRLMLPANGHVSRFIHELFPETDIREFSGTLTVKSDRGPIAGIGLRAGEFTTLPVVPIR
jgi:hypothetical protein